MTLTTKDGKKFFLISSNFDASLLYDKEKDTLLVCVPFVESPENNEAPYGQKEPDLEFENTIDYTITTRINLQKVNELVNQIKENNV